MNRLFWTLLFIFFSAGLRAQVEDVSEKERADFIISANLGGDASILSLGFEKLFFVKPGMTLVGKVGIGFNNEFQLFDDDPPPPFILLPHHFTANFGKRRSMLELGVGGALMTNNLLSRYLLYPIVGYRFHPFKNPGFSFRVWVYYPFGQGDLLDWNEIMFIPYGLSFGIAL